MQKGNKKLFNNRTSLYQLVNLRKMGLSLTTLAVLFGCDIKAVEYHCVRYQVHPMGDVYDMGRILRLIMPKSQPLTYKVVNGERINLGRNYKDYFKAPV